MMNLETILQKLANYTLIVAGLLGLACAFAQFEHYIDKQLEKTHGATFRPLPGVSDDELNFGVAAVKRQGQRP